MFKAISNHAISGRRHAVAAVAASLLAAGGAAPSLAADDDAAARDLTVEQTAIFSVAAPAPATAASGALNVVAWVDHADNTYAVGEAVRLFVRASKDAYLTVLNVGPSGNTTLLFPNAVQKDARVRANQVVQIPGAGSGTSITVSGPVGRELIKVVASTSPVPLFEAANLTGAGPFAMLNAGSRSVARDLQVTMDTQTTHEWDDYNKVINTIANRPVAAMPLGAGAGRCRVAGAGVNTSGCDGQVAVPDGGARVGLRQLHRAVLPDAGRHRLVGTGTGAAAERDAAAEPAARGADGAVPGSRVEPQGHAGRPAGSRDGHRDLQHRQPSGGGRQPCVRA